MSRFPRLARFAAVGAFVVSTLTVFAASPAGATSTGTVVNNGAGGVTVTYVAGANETVALHVYTSLAACDQSNLPPAPDYYLLSLGGTPALGASPATVDGSTQVNIINGGSPTGTIPTGTYQFCLYSLPQSGGSPSFTFLSGVQTTIGTVTPTTSATTTTTAPTTTTADPAPATPVYAG